MLIRLSVEDFALFERCDMELAGGLNALTGETGAGKSLLLDALECILGARASADLIRRECDSALVEAFFAVEKPTLLRAVSEALGFPVENGELLLRRRLQRGGRFPAEANGRSIPISTLKAVGDLLVDIHGQNEHQRLIQPAVQLEALDAYARLEALRERCAKAYERLRDSAASVAAIEAERENLDRENEILTYRVRELEAAALESDDELERLAARRQMAAHHLQIAETLGEVHGRLYEDEDSVNATLERLAARLGRLPEAVSQAERWNKLIDEAAVLLSEAGREAGEFLESNELAPDELERIDDRIAALRALCRKYGPTVADCRKTLETEKLKLDALGSVEVRAAEAAREAEARREEFLETAEDLSRRRHAAAGGLSKKIEGELAALGMHDAKFRTDFRTLTQLKTPQEVKDASPWGLESCEFMLMPNPGEGWSALGRIASGGELARAMLSLKSALARADDTAVLVFDEIDADIGGRLGEAVGRKLRAISERHQVIVVTHLPQIAAFAEKQFRVEKSTRAGRTSADVQPVEGKERLLELAEMLRGPKAVKDALDQAEKMLKAAVKR